LHLHTRDRVAAPQAFEHAGEQVNIGARGQSAGWDHDQFAGAPVALEPDGTGTMCDARNA
jgi:hypothetical protein